MSTKRQKWLLTYRYTHKTRVIWSEFREVLPSGALVFYNSDPETRIAVDHLYAVGSGAWLDVILNPQQDAGDLETLGVPSTNGLPPHKPASWPKAIRKKR